MKQSSDVFSPKQDGPSLNEKTPGVKCCGVKRKVSTILARMTIVLCLLCWTPFCLAFTHELIQPCRINYKSVQRPRFYEQPSVMLDYEYEELGEFDALDEELTEILKEDKSVVLDHVYKGGELLRYIRGRRRPRGATSQRNVIWEHGIIPYEMAKDYRGSYRRMLFEGMREWEKNTCIQFVERGSHPNYIFFRQKDCGCESHVGNREQGKQYITLSEDCCKFVDIIHELGHVIGFYHEHQRPDRDKYVRILYQNIEEGTHVNFGKLESGAVNSLGETYDFDSVMHYHSTAFSKHPSLKTIVPRSGFTHHRLETNTKISAGDFAQANKLYKCPKCGRTLLNPTGSFESPITTPEGVFCQWRILGAHGETIRLKITSMDIFPSDSCDSNYIEIYDGYWHKSPMLGRFCGRTPPGAIRSTARRMVINYRASPGKERFKGFHANYEIACGGEITREQGILQSPYFPYKYRPDKQCTWDIIVPLGYRVGIAFEFLQMEKSMDCSADFVEITDPKNAKTLARLCGDKIPRSIKSFSNTMRIRFESDSHNQYKGFMAKFKKMR